MLKPTLFIICFVSSYSLANIKDPIKTTIAVETDIYQYAKKIMAGKSASQVDDFSHPLCQRDVVDFILILRAFQLFAPDIHFHFEPGNVDGRNIKSLRSGLLLLSFDSIWLTQAERYKDDVYISAPLIRKGEYEAGLYVSSANKDRILIKTKNDIANYTFVSSEHWKVDWQTLKQLKPKRLINESDWISMAKLVTKGWVDVMLAPFQGEPPYRYRGKDFDISAIEHVKVALNDSRHIIVSRSHPLGKRAFEAIQKAIQHYRNNNTIKRAYRECGFLNSHTKDWSVISVDIKNN